MASIRLAVPETVTRGEVFEIKALIQHTMETGYRRDSRGQAIPRDIINTFQCQMNDAILFESEFGPGIAANPFLTFYLRLEEGGELVFTWTDQDGVQWSESKQITVA